LTSIINEKLRFSVVATDFEAVTGGTVRAALRRGYKDQLEIQVIVPPPLDQNDPEVELATQRLTERLSESSGLGSGTW
jgi:hypothetical protein